MADREIRYELRPTLIVGLGGTGHEVLVRLKARYLDAYGEEVFRIIKLLSFDTAEESKEALTEAGTLIQLDKSTELIHIGNVPTTRILKNLELHPTIKSWLPPDLPARSITAGAQQVRPMGRLALFHHFRGKVQPFLEQAIRALSNIRQRGEIGNQAKIANTQGINIFIISSSCGGTGSGIFLDMAYLLRQLCMGQGLDENYCYINGVLVLPQAFASVNSDAIQANTHAALLELDHFTKYGGFAVEYPGGVIATSQVRPFNICYLVDAVNERGKMLAGLNELAPMIAEAVFLQTASQVGDAQKSVFDNVKALDSLDQGYPTAYSGLGTASLTFPTEIVMDACAARYCVNVLQGILLGRPASPETVRVQVNSVMDKIFLTPEVLEREMRQDNNGRAMRIQLDPRQLDQVPQGQLLRAALNRVQQEEDRNLNQLYQQSMEKNLKRLRAEISRMLLQEINRIVDDPELGLDLAIKFLKTLDQHIARVVAEFTQQRQALDQQARKLDDNNRRVQEELEQALGSFIIGRKRRALQKRDHFTHHHKMRLTALFDKNLRSLALNLLAYLSDDVVRVRLRELETLREKLKEAQDRLSRLAAELADGKSRALNPLTYEITDAGDVDKYYQEYVRDLGQEVPRLFEEHGRLHTWDSRSYDEVYQTLLHFGRSVFEGIRQVSIEQVIRDKRDEETPEVRLERLREDSTPFWNRDLTRLADGGAFMETLTVIGVSDAADTIYREVREGEAQVSTRNPHAVTVLTTRHGLTVYALQQFDDYKRAYERHLERAVSPLHCFDIGNTRWLKTLFALGQAFNFIRREANRFYFYPQAKHKSLQKKIELGVGLHNAVHRFVTVPDYSQQLETMVEQYIATEGQFQTSLVIEDYITAPLSRSSELQELEEELKSLLFDYREETGLPSREEAVLAIAGNQNDD